MFTFFSLGTWGLHWELSLLILGSSLPPFIPLTHVD
jgi:hypothetical protein